jgi:hypothetical protein
MTKYRDEPAARDEDLRDLLRQWDAPPLPDGLDERMLARYRRSHLAWWRRPVPVRFSLPFAAVLLVAAGVILAGRSRPPASEGPSAPASPVVAAAAHAGSAFARTSLAGFRPMAEVTATVVTVSP